MLTKKMLSALQAILAACIIGASMWLVEASGVGWFTYTLSAIPLGIIMDTTWRGFARKIGMILVASSAASLLAAPLLGYFGSFPLWRHVMLYWGFALAWLTTPNMPPWWKYISGGKELDDGKSA